MSWVVVSLGFLAAALGAALGYLWGTSRVRGQVAARDSQREFEANARERALSERAAVAESSLAVVRQELDTARASLAAERAERVALERGHAANLARIEEFQRAAAEREALLLTAEARLREAFQSLAAEALAGSEQRFLQLASERMAAVHQAAQSDLTERQRAVEALVAPLREALQAMDGKLGAIESERQHAYGRLVAQVENMVTTQRKLESETARLVRALRSPGVRGRWGEMQLRRVVELAGMVEHCDFSEQVTLTSEHSDEGHLRPDLVVHLPGNRRIVVDAKVPLEAYLDAMTMEDDEARQARLQAHAEQVRIHLGKLSAKSYWERLSGTPEFVVLFLPGEVFYSAALQTIPGLIEEASERRVLIATPTTLIALLQTARLGWREERLAENAQKISEQGRALHKNLVTLFDHWVTLGKALAKATDTYNAAVGSLERRVLPSARKLEELGAKSSKDLPDGEQLLLTGRPRLLASLGERDEEEAGTLDTSRTVVHEAR